MRDPQRIIPMMIEMAHIWHDKFPDMRFCQWILSEMDDYKNYYSMDDCFYVEDDKFLGFLRRKYN